MHFHSRLSFICPNSVVFAVGWSEIIPEEFYSNRTVFVLHPSPLPEYRGGSPIQHQILEDRKTSAVTIFKLDKEHPDVDSGPIVFQEYFPLQGQMRDILGEISRIGAEGIIQCAKSLEENRLLLIEQDHSKATKYLRRTPEMSEIAIDDFRFLTARQIELKIRALQDPYPNAYVVCSDGQKLYLTGAHL